MKLRPYTDDEWGKLPTIIINLGDNWDPGILDYSLSGKDNWKDEVEENERSPHSLLFDKYGDYKHCTPDIEAQEHNQE